VDGVKIAVAVLPDALDPGAALPPGDPTGVPPLVVDEEPTGLLETECEGDPAGGLDTAGDPEGLGVGAGKGGETVVTGASTGAAAGVADVGVGVAFVGAGVEAAGALAGAFEVCGDNAGEETGPPKDVKGAPAAAHWLMGGVLTLQAPGRAKAFVRLIGSPRLLLPDRTWQRQSTLVETIEESAVQQSLPGFVSLLLVVTKLKHGDKLVIALVQSEEDEEEGEGACATAPTAIKTATKAKPHAFFPILKQKPLIPYTQYGRGRFFIW
jgi:hypothetical protein